MPDPVIECRNLTHRYGERLIYENLSFEVPHGRILGLLGKNGTGKTTTINILNGYLEPVAGECLIFRREHPHDEAPNAAPASRCCSKDTSSTPS